jgi:hypothetical protein
LHGNAKAFCRCEVIAAGDLAGGSGT